MAEFWQNVGPMPRMPSEEINWRRSAQQAGLSGFAMTTPTASSSTPSHGGLLHTIERHIARITIEAVLRHAHRIAIMYPLRFTRRHIIKVKAPMPIKQKSGSGGPGV